MERLPAKEKNVHGIGYARREQRTESNPQMFYFRELKSSGCFELCCAMALEQQLILQLPL
jgi:hypothetical protein